MNADNHKVVVEKRITVEFVKGLWKLNFEGPITRADINRLTRTMKVEYARVCRQRSIERKKRLHLEELERSEASKLTIHTETK